MQFGRARLSSDMAVDEISCHPIPSAPLISSSHYHHHLHHSASRTSSNVIVIKTQENIPQQQDLSPVSHHNNTALQYNATSSSNRRQHSVMESNGGRGGGGVGGGGRTRGGASGTGGKSSESTHSLDEEPPTKRVRASPTKSAAHEFNFRFLVSSKDAGAIIGKGGGNINRLRKLFKSHIIVPDSPGPERVLSVVCGVDELSEIVREVACYCDEKLKSNEKIECELRMLVHTTHAGTIIGRNGQRIQELRDRNKIGIKVFTECCPASNERVICLSGPLEPLLRVVGELAQLVLETPIKGRVILYDPLNHDDLASVAYGGFASGPEAAHHASRVGGGGGRPLSSTSLGHPSHPPPIPVSFYEHSASRMEWARVEHDHAEREWARSHKAPQHDLQYNDQYSEARKGQVLAIPARRPPAWTGNGPMGESYMPYWHDPSGEQQLRTHAHASLPVEPYEPSVGVESCATLTVQNEVAGAIIGKGGSRIRNVRRESGADISIDSTVAVPGSNKERLITIRGTNEQVRLAYDMLQRSIMENSRPSH